MSAGPYATAAGRDIINSAIGTGATVTNINIAHSAVRVSWPVRVGTPPPCASAFQPRLALRAAIDEARRAGDDVVLAQVLSGGGGVGKSQLAAAYAHEAARVGSGIDLVMWVSAADVQQVIALYAHTARLVQAPGALSQDVEADARAFLGWLAATSRKWLVILDDVTDPAALAPWWPAVHSGTGWVLATTRLKDSRLTGQGRSRVNIDVYTSAEAAAYVEHRLTRDALAYLLDGSQEQLALELGFLPLALGHAVAYLINQQMACSDYLELFRGRERSLEEMLPGWADAENYGRQVTAALLLSRAAAEAASPRGLALPVLQLAAFLDPAGHPAALWDSYPVLSYLAGLDVDEHGLSVPVSRDQVQESLRVLNRYALITYDPQSTGQEVRMHALTARAVQETTPHVVRSRLVRTAGDALHAIWPDGPGPGPGREISEILCANTITLTRHIGRALWEKGTHKVLFQAGESMLSNGLLHSALTHFEELLAVTEEKYGAEHADAFRARTYLASTYNLLGHYDKAQALYERLLADTIRLHDGDHPSAHTARAFLAATYSHLGRYDEALRLEEKILAACIRIFGDDYVDTDWARANLAVTYNQLGRHTDALLLCEHVLVERIHAHGSDHPDTHLARSNLAATYGSLGRDDDALALCERVLAGYAHFYGEDHPDTQLARANLAGAHSRLGHHHHALLLEEQVLAARIHLLGDDHPDTHRARSNLAVTYNQLGRHGDALPLAKQALAARVRLLGDGHPHTIRSLAILATTRRFLSPSDAPE
ncbi:FxSxx-COOH system tetratricopeptide repeat protein [Streptomyces sp. NBC_00536]|uniref:FxSxx-COOH system tetratricopeptide repeat protein n=1 Tax=Streptomyces sp. NBC_00536 TaxID=2975769 RepID=UPI002E7FF4B8|nr:FxSxx-COOH system tetratricopeptide repeat protein [Streptomyces sp. NBC_00536]WUC83489.1 FxSxx-COOH system tetratricopeptide repeat protein [Streptomyces sp. NBC_00536]